MKAHAIVCFLLGIGLGACTQQQPYEVTPGQAGGGTGATGGGTGNGNQGAENINGTKEGEDFFNGQIVAAFRSSGENCLSCHDAPRNVLGNPDASDEAIYDYDEMFRLLKKGGFSNDNDFINPMLGKDNHPGAQICEDESAELCQLAIEWYGIEFSDGGSRFGVVEGVDISFDGINVKGEARDVSNPELVLTVRAYLDGESGVGTMVGEGQASGFEESYNFRLDDAVRDNGEHEVYLYAVVDGKEEALGSVSFTAYRPRGAATYPGATTVIGGNANGCGCHEGGFPYSVLWPDLTIPVGGQDGANARQGIKPSARNNYLIDLATGQRGTNHPAGQVGNVQAIAEWWCAEFDPDNAQCVNN